MQHLYASPSHHLEPNTPYPSTSLEPRFSILSLLKHLSPASFKNTCPKLSSAHTCLSENLLAYLPTPLPPFLMILLRSLVSFTPFHSYPTAGYT